ncbi:MAG: hypothetical protein K8H86_01105, partial [Ignavibacteriaceae bacterium]|nr:hypothetical protein [Ignavibacteriaceae bacterium]
MKIFLFILFYSVIIFGQAGRVERKGTVTYLSSQNVYVKFDNTEGITPGDTLFVKQNNKLTGAIIINFISSRSTAGGAINGIKLEVGNEVAAFARVEKEPMAEIKDTAKIAINEEEIVQKLITPDVTRPKVPVKTEAFKGKISAQSYSNLNNIGGSVNIQRWRYTFALDAENISESGFSISNYMSFAYKANDWKNLKNNIGGALRVYDLAVKYDFDESTTFWLGRHLNRKISNISSVDGLQFEKYFGSFYTGALIGSRPDYSNLGFNLKLFEYGAYAGKTDSINGRVMENTIAAVQQTNNYKTDRRFIYF